MLNIQEISRPEMYDESQLTVKQFHNSIEAMYQTSKNTKQTTRKLSKDEFIVLSTGEIKKFKKTENRKQNVNTLRVTLKKLRDVINYNVVDVAKCKWVTLTYKENMQDHKRLYKDIEKFFKKMKYWFPKFEYIYAIEPQKRGAWHAHIIFIFEKKAPYISNGRLADLWGHGFTNTQKLNNCDNLGAYLSAYLGDMELDPKEETNGNIKETSNGKRYVKGARLALYPTGIKLFRTSRGIQKVKPKTMTLKELILLVKRRNYFLHKEKSIFLQDTENDFTKTIMYQTYVKRYDIDTGGQLKFAI